MSGPPSLSEASLANDCPGVSISSVFKSWEGKAEVGMSTQRHAEINIFTVASGLSYEVRPT